MSRKGDLEPQQGHDLIRRFGHEQLYNGRKKFLLGVDDFTAVIADRVGAAPLDPRGDHPWVGQPWVTPVVGSGPLGLPQKFVAASGDLADGVVRRVRSMPVADAYLTVGDQVEGWLYRFVSNLVEQRVADDRAAERAADFAAARMTLDKLAGSLKDHAVLVTMLAAQLTRTFHRISLDAARPLSRWGSESGTLPHAHPRAIDLKDEYTEPLGRLCQVTLQSLTRLAGTGELQAATTRSIAALVNGVHANLNKPDGALVARMHVEQMTETAWYLLVDSIVEGAYPGWTNLLLRLILANENAEIGVHARPRWADLQKLSNVIRTIVEPVSRTAWQWSNVNAEHRENRDFYDSVARTLWAQNKARRAWIDHPPSGIEGSVPPRAVAYVSSFDYELEMALWRTAQGKQFSVIVPAYAVRDRSPNVGEFVWLEATIDTSAQRTSVDGEQDPAAFDLMRQVTSWRVIDRMTPPESFYDHPLVIRLVGCPLLSLPGTDDNKEELRRGSLANSLNRAHLGDVTSFVHAVTVDEFLALRQTEREWAWSAVGPNNHNRGLPEKYFGTTSMSARRYWMIMGVPFQDPAVRLRLMSIFAREGPQEFARAEVREQTSKVQATEVAAPAPPRTGLKPRQGTATQRSAGTMVDESVEYGDLSSDEAAGQRYGLAISTRIGDEETTLLASLGFAVVQGRCEDFTRDLNEHADWITRNVELIADQPAGGENA